MTSESGCAPESGAAGLSAASPAYFGYPIPAAYRTIGGEMTLSYLIPAGGVSEPMPWEGRGFAQLRPG